MEIETILWFGGIAMGLAACAQFWFWLRNNVKTRNENTQEVKQCQQSETC